MAIHFATVQYVPIFIEKFNYSPNGFMPMHPKMHEMFQHPKLSNEQIQDYHDIFVNEIHNPKYLTKQDENIQKAIPIFEQTIETRIKPLLGAWNATMPERATVTNVLKTWAGF